MKRNILSLLILAESFLNLSGQTAAPFQKTFGTTANDNVSAFIKASDGSLYFAGAANGDAYIMKTDSLGNILWNKRYGGTGNDEAFSITQLTDGNIVIGGLTMSYGPGVSGNWPNHYVVKVDQNGNHLWTRALGGSGSTWDHCTKVLATPDGGVLSIGPAWFLGAGNDDMYWVKLDANGNTVYRRSIGGGDNDWSNSASTTSDNGFVICGMTQSFGFGGGDQDMYMVKTDANGNVAFSRTYGGAGSEGPAHIIQCSDGDYLFIGTTPAFGAGMNDILAVKIATNGALVWAKTYGGSNNDNATKMVSTPDGNVVILGSTSSFGSSQDMLIFKIDLSGNVIWSKTYGGAGSEGSSDIIENGGGRLLVLGSTNSFGLGSNDIYFLKLDASGNASGCTANTVTLISNPAAVTIGSGGTVYSNGTSTSATSGTSNQIFSTYYHCGPLAGVTGLSSISGCAASCTSIVSVIPKGGIAPITYSWSTSPPQTTQTASNVCPGTYTVTVTDASAASFTALVTVTAPPQIQASSVNTSVTCNGGANGAIDLSVSGGAPNRCLAFDGSDDYVDIPGLNWTPNQYSIEWWHFPLTRSNYNQVLTATAGWGAFQFHTTANGEVYVGTDVATRLTPTELPANTLVLNQWHHFTFTFNNGVGKFYKNGVLLATKNMNMPAAWNGFRISTTGGTSAINGRVDNFRVWNTELSAATVSMNFSSCGALSPGHPNYTNLLVEYLMNEGNGTVANNNMSGNYPGTLTNGPVWATTAQTNYGCNSPGGYSFQWSNSAFTEDISGLTANTYSVAIKDGNGCTHSYTTAIAQPAPVTLSFSPAAPALCAGTSVSLSVAGGTSYTWTPSSSLSSSVGSNVTASPTVTTVYTVNTLDGNACPGSKTVAVLVNPLPLVTIAGSGTICSGAATAFTASGATSYTWNTGSQNATATVSPAITTTYSVTGTDANGCKNSASKTLTVIATPTAMAGSGQTITCSTGTVSLSGSGVSTYTWSGPSIVSGLNTAGPLVNAPGTYSLTGSSNGCTSNTATVTVLSNTVPPVISISASSNTLCAGNNVTLTASGANTYSWNTGSITATIAESPSLTFTYQVTGTNSINGCTASAAQVVTVYSVPVVSVAGGSICEGQTYTIAPSGAASYTYSGGSPIVSPTVSTVYTVSGTSSQGCVGSSATLTVNVFALPVVTANSSTTSVCSGNSITLTGAGATSYSWNAGVSDGVPFYPSQSAVYTVTGSDGNNCLNTATIAIQVNPLPQTPTISANGLTLTSSAATGNQWYLNGAPVLNATSPSYTIASNGNYMVCTTDNFGCQACSPVYSMTSVGVNKYAGGEISISVYPNPNKGKFKVTSKTTGRAELYNDIGQLVRSVELEENNDYSADISSLSKGIYLLRLGDCTRKIVVTD